MLEANVFPGLGSRPLAEIDAPELLAVLKRIEARGAHETAHRVKARMGQVFRYAIAHGTATRDPSADLRGALAPVVSRSHAAVTEPAQVADLLRALDGYDGQRSADNTSELQSLMRILYAVFCLKKKTTTTPHERYGT